MRIPVGSPLEGGFSCLFLASQTEATRTLLVKRNKDSSEFPEGRTLFVINIDPFFKADALKFVFSQFGVVEDLKYQRLPGKKMEGLSDYLSFAHVVFQTQSSVDKLLEKLAKGTQKWVKDPEDLEYLGSLNVDKEEAPARSFFRQYSSAEAVEATANNLVLAYERDEREQAALEALSNQPDADGWITSNSGTDLQARPPKKSRKRKGPLMDFYTFQERERKEAEMARALDQRQKDEDRVKLLRTQG